MVLKKVILYAFVLMALAFTNRDSAITNTTVIITSDSSLVVRGTTNVSTFSCVFNINKFKNPIQVNYYMDGDKMAFNKTALILETSCFDCGGKAINSDFQKILKSDKYPQITLFLKEISQIENTLDFQALVNIDVAGITKTYKIPVKFKKNNDMLITGNLAISAADHNLEMPNKLFGLIYVNDKIEIYFQLTIQEK